MDFEKLVLLYQNIEEWSKESFKGENNLNKSNVLKSLIMGVSPSN
jgi:hypothetical protein